jgi:hypothetical protein
MAKRRELLGMTALLVPDYLAYGPGIELRRRLSPPSFP